MQEYTNHSDTTFALRNISFRVPGRTLLHPLSLTFPAGKVTGLIGHNGSGKSTLLKMLGRHQPPSEGEILLDAQPLESWGSKAFARKVAYLPQQLPPAEGMTVRELVAIGRYPWHGALGRFGAADREKVEEAISLVGLKPLAHQLSGGMSQRVMIAMAIACRPKLLIADEPTTALDVTIQAQIIELLLELQQKENMALVLITHDLALVAEAAHKIIVMYAGQVVETGDAHAIFHAPRHPYTQALLRALPEFAQDKERLASLPGVVPGKYDRPNGCLLNPRCPYATDKCRAEEPALNMLADGRQSKCHYPLDDAGRPTL